MSKRHVRFEDDVEGFMREYGRQKNGGRQPADRKYDRMMEHTIKHMDARDFDLDDDSDIDDDDFDDVDLGDFDLRFQNRPSH